ncbi:MAG: carboxypeptidase regulatory-like domain-containing protein [Acidobacteria bacterium]|nr:carboxypeptidase regulatory-like domain-containing protein [Acidobacteriota bacterium]
MKRQNRLLLVLVCVPVLLWPNRSPAQITSATILGTVADASGAVVPNAQVTATNVETNFSRSANTDALGQYVIKFLPIGAYRVEFSANNFKKFVQTGVVLELNRSARVDPVLEIGEFTDTVSVTADAPQVNTTDASLGRTVDNAEILNLPLVNRDVYSLLRLTPGVELTETGNAFGYPGQRALINGSSDGGTGSVNYYLDGGNNMAGLRNTGNPVPNPDAVQEFRVITNSYGAEFGRFAGGVIDVVNKSGTNAMHGSLFEFIRNDKLNANTWSATERPPLRRNQFGGSFGGPIVKNRTFYFASYSGLRQRQVDFENSAIVPTSLERQGNFSASRDKPIDPLTRQPFPNAIIPLDRFDPAAKRVLDQYVPQANLPGNFFEVTQPHPLDSDEFQLKLDHALSPSHQLTGSYFLNKGKDIEALQGDLPWAKREFTWKQQNFNIGDTWTANPTTVNQLRLTYVRNFGGRLNLPATSLGDLGSRYLIQGPKALPELTVTGYFDFDMAIAGPVAGSNYYGLRELLSLTRGRHSLKLGADFSLEKFIHDTTLDNYGTFDFDGSRTGNALADFLLGSVVRMTQDAPVTKTDNVWYSGFFVQDDFRIHPRFTLNLGLRYDLQLPMTDPQDRKLTYVAGVQSKVVPSAPLGLLFPGDAGIARGIVAADKNNFAPRVGFAWDPFGDGKTSVRSAFGLFYGSIGGNEWNGSADRQPFSIRQRFNDVKSLSDPYGNLPGGVSPFPYVYSPTNPRFLLPASVGPISLDFRWPYNYQLNFSVQRQLTSDLTMTAAYVGAMGHKLPFKPDINYPIFRAGATSGNVDLRRPILPGTLSSIGLLPSMMNNAYHGLQLTVEKRTSRNVAFKGFYTFSKSIDGAEIQNSSTSDAGQNQNNLRMERARTSSDRRHNFVVSAIWDINYFNGLNPVARAILNDWKLSSIVTLRSGEPFTVTSGRDNNLDGVNNDRANLVGDPLLSPNRSRAEATARWFNTAAFVRNATGQDGNAGRNILDGPGLKNADIGIFRDFRLSESMRLQFRAEMTNAFNLVNLRNPNSNLNSSAVGTIREARDMRQVQLGLRLSF